MQTYRNTAKKVYIYKDENKQKKKKKEKNIYTYLSKCFYLPRMYVQAQLQVKKQLTRSQCDYNT